MNGSDTSDAIYGDGDAGEAADDGADFIFGDNGRIDRRFVVGNDVLYLPWTVNKVCIHIYPVIF